MSHECSNRDCENGYVYATNGMPHECNVCRGAAMTAKLEICAAHGNFVAATYTPDRTASVTALGSSACDAVANLRVYLQPFGYELPRIEIYASGGVDSDTPCSTSDGLLNVAENGPRLARALGSNAHTTQDSRCNSGPLASPISECESAVDRVFKQHLSTGRN